MLYHPAMPKWFEPRAVTKPIPLSLAFEIARSMQNLPMTGPKKRENNIEMVIYDKVKKNMKKT